MKSQRTSFHITPKTKAIVAENGDQAKRINFLISACAEMMKSPQFTVKEWMIIVASANGLHSHYQDGLEAVLRNFANCIPYAAIILGSEYEQINKEELARKYLSLPINQKLFVFELARKFWIPKDTSITSITSYKLWLTENGAIVVKE